MESDANQEKFQPAFLTQGATTRNSGCSEVSEGREALGTAGQETALRFLVAGEEWRFVEG
jgi:hypothetical protein